jgi:proline racemase
VAATIEKVRDWIQEKRVGAAQLRVSYQESATPVTVVSVPGAPGMITMKLEDMNAEEMMMTMEDADETAFDMVIEEEDFGEQQSGVAYG